MFCTKCGKENRDDAKFCVACGEQLLEDSATSLIIGNEIQKRKNNLVKSKGIHVTVIAICVFMLISIIAVGSSGVLKNLQEGECIDNYIEDKDALSLYEKESTDAITNSETNTVSDNDSTEREEEQLPENQTTITEQESNYFVTDAHSVWGNGRECRILMYLDEKNMLVKIPFGDYIVQAVVPREFENGFNVDSEFYSDGNGKINNAYLELVDVNRTCAVRLIYVCGAEYSVECQELTFENLQKTVTEYEDSFNKEITLYECEMVDGKQGMVINLELDIEQKYFDDIQMSGYAIIQNDIVNEICYGGVIVYADEDRAAEAQKNVEQFGFSINTEDDYEYTALYQEEELDLRLRVMYEKYLAIVENPYDIFTDDIDASRFASLGEYWLMDLTQDGIPEIICIGEGKWVYIVGEQNYISLGGISDIYQTEDPNVIIVKGGWPGETTWDKYEVGADNNGNLSIELLERAYIKSYDDWECGTVVNKIHGEEISQEEIETIVDEIITVNYKYPQLVCYSDEVFTLSGFHKFKRHLNNNVLFVSD